MARNKSVLEEALLEAQALEEAVKSNAKEILASTMKEEIEELVISVSNILSLSIFIPMISNSEI